MQSQTFRQSSCATVAGAFLGLVGGTIFGVASYHLATGAPLWQGGSKLHSGLHVASGSELWFGVVGGLPLLLFGVVLLLTAVNCGVTIDEQGISATNLLRRTVFRARWSEIGAIERTGPKSASGCKLTANGKTLRLDTSIANVKALIDEIERRSPTGQVVGK